MEMARDARLPIVIHCRASDNSNDAWNDCLDLLREHWSHTGLGGILHCFTGTLEHAHAALDMRFMVSFAGNVTFPKLQTIRDVARQLPPERILIETDSPFLAPVPHRGKRNEPAFLVEVARHIAAVRGVSLEEVAEQTTRNFFDFFKLQSSNVSSAV
jgi:TatD DNase family protein